MNKNSFPPQLRHISYVTILFKYLLKWQYRTGNGAGAKKKEIRKKKEFFMAKFEEIDGKTGFLSWDQIIDVFHDNNTILFEEIDQLEYYCYLLNNSLKKIPYDVVL